MPPVKALKMKVINIMDKTYRQQDLQAEKALSVTLNDINSS